MQVRFSGAGERSFLKKKNSNYSEGNCEGTGHLRKINKKTDVCDTREAIDGTKWYYVRIAGKYFGFMAARYIERQ